MRPLLTFTSSRKNEHMTRITAIGILIVAAGLEAGGDALMRVGLHTSALWRRLALFSVAGIALFAYGWTVNAPPWDFGKLLGLYVVFFFLSLNSSHGFSSNRFRPAQFFSAEPSSFWVASSYPLRISDHGGKHMESGCRRER